MKASEFINEDIFGIEPKRPSRPGSRPPRGHEAEIDERGKASVKLCKSTTPDEDLGASQLSSCKAQGLRSRDGQKAHRIGKKMVKIKGKKIKGKKYGGPLPDYSSKSK